MDNSFRMHVMESTEDLLRSVDNLFFLDLIIDNSVK